MTNANIVHSNILRVEGHKGSFVGFFHSGGKPELKGWWVRRDGSEGGELQVCCVNMVALDFDGCFNLPKYVKDELKLLGITCDWSE